MEKPVSGNPETARVMCDGCDKQTLVFEEKQTKEKLGKVMQTYTHKCSECDYEGIIVNINGANRLVNPSNLY